LGVRIPALDQILSLKLKPSLSGLSQLFQLPPPPHFQYYLILHHSFTWNPVVSSPGPSISYNPSSDQELADFWFVYSATIWQGQEAHTQRLFKPILSWFSHPTFLVIKSTYLQDPLPDTILLLPKKQQIFFGCVWPYLEEPRRQEEITIDSKSTSIGQS
jgi:hypothetical protein